MASEPQHRCSCGLVMQVPANMAGLEVVCLRCGRVSKARRTAALTQIKPVKLRSRRTELLIHYTQLGLLVVIALVSIGGLFWCLAPAGVTIGRDFPR